MEKYILRVLSIPERLRNIVLFYVFNFHKWHISPSKNRIYPIDIINYVNNIPNTLSVCEIGCGLGDIISHINAKKKWDMIWT